MSASCRQMTGRRSARDGSAENPQTGRRRGDEEEGELRDAASVAGARRQKVRRKEARARRTTGSERGPRESSSNGTGEAAGARRGPERRNGEETRCPPRPRGVWRLRGKQSPGGDKPEPKDDTASRLQTPRALRVPGRPASEGRREAGPGAGALLPLGSTAGLSPRTQEAACFTGLSVFTPEPKQPNTMQAQLPGMSLAPAARNGGDGVTGQRRAAAKPRRGTPASREPMPRPSRDNTAAKGETVRTDAFSYERLEEESTAIVLRTPPGVETESS